MLAFVLKRMRGPGFGHVSAGSAATVRIKLAAVSDLEWGSNRAACLGFAFLPAVIGMSRAASFARESDLQK